MPMARKILYDYIRDKTSAGTGYFKCVPREAYTLDMALELLNERPLDTFLHQYALDLLLGQDTKRIGEMDASSTSAMALLHEASRCRGLMNLEGHPASLEDTPLPLLAEKKPSHQPGIEQILANLNLGAPLAGLSPDTLDALSGGDVSLLTDTIPAKIDERPEKQAMPASEIWRLALARLGAAGLLEEPEMRHEASLSPIALLRQWPLRVESLLEPQCALEGVATAYGRGYTLAGARASLHMEIVERASAHAGFEPGGKYGFGKVIGRNISLYKASISQLERKELKFHSPASRELADNYKDVEFHWLLADDDATWIPCQAVFLFTNLNEPSIFELGGSTGLGAGDMMERARLAALLEIIERDSHATTPFVEKDCFIAASRDQALQSLLNDYRLKGIHPVFQDITAETGIPAYRCLVRGFGGDAALGSSASLCGKDAALSALAETPWPYSWASMGGKPSKPPSHPLPVVYLEDLPDYSYGNSANDLRVAENALERTGLKPVYVDLTRPDLGFPVCRAFIPGLETHAEFRTSLPARLVARIKSQLSSGG